MVKGLFYLALSVLPIVFPRIFDRHIVYFIYQRERKDKNEPKKIQKIKAKKMKYKSAVETRILFSILFCIGLCYFLLDYFWDITARDLSHLLEISFSFDYNLELNNIFGNAGILLFPFSLFFIIFSKFIVKKYYPNEYNGFTVEEKKLKRNKIVKDGFLFLLFSIACLILGYFDIFGK